MTLRPQGMATVEQEPDGDFEVRWVWGGCQLSLLLTLEQLRALNAEGIDAAMLARPVAPVEKPAQARPPRP